MPICREGHDSATEDYCDECGAPILTAARSEAATVEAEACPVCGAPRTGRFCEEDGYDFVLKPPVSPGGSSTPAAPVGPSAPVERESTEPPSDVADAQARPTTTVGEASVAGRSEAAVTEAQPAGAESAGRPAAAAPGWVAVITADRAYFDSVIARNGPDAASISFPTVCPPRRIRLTDPQVLIGRHSASRGLHPQIDLTGPPEDPGVSHLHAVLQAEPDGGWSIIDPGSTNGTTINDDDSPIEVDVAVPLRPGDRIHVGAWTTITLDVG